MSRSLPDGSRRLRSVMRLKPSAVCEYAGDVPSRCDTLSDSFLRHGRSPLPEKPVTMAIGEVAEGKYVSDPVIEEDEA